VFVNIKRLFVFATDGLKKKFDKIFGPGLHYYFSFLKSRKDFFSGFGLLKFSVILGVLIASFCSTAVSEAGHSHSCIIRESPSAGCGYFSVFPPGQVHLF
jgi:hypothetical protein